MPIGTSEVQNISGVSEKERADFEGEYNKWLSQRSKKESSSSQSWHSLLCMDGNNVDRDEGGSLTGDSGGEVSTGGGGEVLSNSSREETNSLFPVHRDIHGFQNEILALKHFLLKKKDYEEFKTIAVVGRRGVGKTALCQKVLNIEEIKKAYVPRIWVSMYKEGSQEDTDPKKAILKRILINLGVGLEKLNDIMEGAKQAYKLKEEEEERVEGTFEEEELAILLYGLHLNLWGKKYLIVLDDVCEGDGWNEGLNEEKQEEKMKWGKRLACGFPKGYGGRVIITSSDENLAMKLVGKEENLHRLYPMSDADNCWNVYVDSVKENYNNKEVKPRNPRKSKEDLMNKSGGIPLVARMLGKIEPVELHDELYSPTEGGSGRSGSSHGRKVDDEKISEEKLEGTDDKRETNIAKE